MNGFDNAAYKFTSDDFIPATKKKNSVDEEQNNNSSSPVNDDNNERGSWGKDIEFLFSCIALSVGLGNIWRFPFVALENGGGSYLSKYIESAVQHVSNKFSRSFRDTLRHSVNYNWQANVLHGDGDGTIFIKKQCKGLWLRSSSERCWHGTGRVNDIYLNLLLCNDGDNLEISLRLFSFNASMELLQARMGTLHIFRLRRLQ